MSTEIIEAPAVESPGLPARRGSSVLQAVETGGVEHVSQTLDTLRAIRTFLDQEFKRDHDFGIIPGTGNKPTLFQPGAQKAVMYFNAAPDARIKTIELGNGHVEFRVKTNLVHRATGVTIGSGWGSCSTMEKKYRYRGSSRVCPDCGQSTIINGKKEYGGGFLCFTKKGGCGSKFKDDNKKITSQAEGMAENPDIYDTRNTVLKMALKRSLVNAALALGCLSEMFTQDFDDDVYDLSQKPQESTGEPEPMGDQRYPENRPSNNSGYKTGQYASPDQTREFMDRLKGFLEVVNQRWADLWGDPNILYDLPQNVKEPVNIYQADNHLLKWAVESGRLDPKIVPEHQKMRQLGAYTAIVFFRADDDGRLTDQAAMRAEMNRYARTQTDRAMEAVYRARPDLKPDEGPSEDDQPEREAGMDG